MWRASRGGGGGNTPTTLTLTLTHGYPQVHQDGGRNPPGVGVWLFRSMPRFWGRKKRGIHQPHPCGASTTEEGEGPCRVHHIKVCEGDKNGGIQVVKRKGGLRCIQDLWRCGGKEVRRCGGAAGGVWWLVGGARERGAGAYVTILRSRAWETGLSLVLDNETDIFGEVNVRGRDVRLPRPAGYPNRGWGPTSA